MTKNDTLTFAVREDSGRVLGRMVSVTCMQFFTPIKLRIQGFAAHSPSDLLITSLVQAKKKDAELVSTVRRAVGGAPASTPHHRAAADGTCQQSTQSFIVRRLAPQSLQVPSKWWSDYNSGRKTLAVCAASELACDLSRPKRTCGIHAKVPAGRERE